MPYIRSPVCSLSSRLFLRCTDYTHIIAFGGNDLGAVGSAISRYSMGGVGYVDPVATENVFELVYGTLQPTFSPLITVSSKSLVNG